MQRKFTKVLIVFAVLLAFITISVSAKSNYFSEGNFVSSFSYNGNMTINKKPATGKYDLKFDLYDKEVGGKIIGSRTINDVSVVKSKYKVDLRFEFNEKVNKDCWIEVSANTWNKFTVVEGRKHIKIEFDGLYKKWLAFIKYLPSDIIESRHIVDGTITEQDFANGSVTQNKIRNQSVSLDKINTQGASNGDALMFNGSSLAWANPQQSSQNGPIAYAFINKSGKKISGTNNLSVQLQSTGYLVKIEGEDYYPGKHLVFITPNSPCTSQISMGELKDGSILVSLYSLTSTDIEPSDFQIIVYKTNYTPVFTKYYRDLDSDGYGTSSHYIMAEEPEEKYTAVKDGDFDDNDSNSYPGAPEVPDKKDNDGDGEIDEDFEGSIYYRDEDQDGYGKTEYGHFGIEYSDFIYLVEPEYPYTATVAGDWEDLNTEAHPGITDIPDGIDNDFDGVIDEDFMPIAMEDVSYDLYTCQDLSIQLPLRDGVSKVKYNNAELSAEIEYTFGDNDTLIISKNFMQKLAIGEHTFTIDFSTSWRGTLTVTVSDSDPRAKDLVKLTLVKGSEDTSDIGILNPLFTGKNYQYTASITDGTNFVGVISTPAEGTTVQIKCVEQTYTSPNCEVTNLKAGANIIEVTVSEDGKESKVYTITVNVSMTALSKTTPANESIVQSGDVIYFEMQGDALYYTLDGTNPVEDSENTLEYNPASGIVVTGNIDDIITIKAMQTRNDMKSDVATFTFTIGE